MVWNRKSPRRVSRERNVHLGILIINSARLNQYLYTAESIKTEGISQSLYAVRFLEAIQGEGKPYQILRDIEAIDEKDGLSRYSLLHRRLFKEAGSHTLDIFAKEDEATLQTILPHFFRTKLYLMLNELFGYILLVDARFFDIPASVRYEHDVDGNHREVIQSVKQGWFGVEAAKAELKILKELDGDAPCVIVVLNSKVPNAMPEQQIRKALELNDETEIVTHDIENSDDAFHILRLLAETHEAVAGKNPYADLVMQIVK